MAPLDKPLIQLVDAMELISSSMADPHRWSMKERRAMRSALDHLLKVTGELDNIEIGPEPTDTWKTINDGGSL